MKIKSDYYSNKGLELLTLTGFINRKLNSFSHVIGDLDISREEIAKRVNSLTTGSGYMALYKVKSNLLKFGIKVYVDADEEEKRMLIEIIFNDNI